MDLIKMCILSRVIMFHFTSCDMLCKLKLIILVSSVLPPGLSPHPQIDDKQSLPVNVTHGSFECNICSKISSGSFPVITGWPHVCPSTGGAESFNESAFLSHQDAMSCAVFACQACSCAVALLRACTELVTPRCPQTRSGC